MYVPIFVTANVHLIEVHVWRLSNFSLHCVGLFIPWGISCGCCLILCMFQERPVIVVQQKTGMNTVKSKFLL